MNFSITFTYVLTLSLLCANKKSPLRSFLFAVGGEVSAEHPSDLGLIQLSAEVETG